MITLVFRQLENNKWNEIQIWITASTYNHQRLNTTHNLEQLIQRIFKRKSHRNKEKDREREREFWFIVRFQRWKRKINESNPYRDPGSLFYSSFTNTLFKLEICIGFWCIKINKCQCQQTLACHFQSFLDIVHCSRYFGYAIFYLLNRCASWL